MNVKVIIPPKSNLSKYVAEKLVDYILQVTNKKIPITNDINAINDNSTVIVIGNERRNKIAKQLGFKHDWRKMRIDGYVLKTIKRNRGLYIIAAGKGEVGDKYAVYRLIQEIKVNGSNISFGNYNIAETPFIKTREVIMGVACLAWDPFAYEDEIPENERAMTYDIIYNSLACQINFPDTPESHQRPKTALSRIVKKYCIENWDIDKLMKYVEQMDCYGFNSIQYSDEFEAYMHSGSLVTRRELREKLQAMMAKTRAIGNQVTLMFFGGVGFNFNGIELADWNEPLVDSKVIFPKANSMPALSYCWNEPQGRKNIEARTTYLSEYAPYIDHILTWFVDPGGCNKNGCTISTCMAILNYQYKIFKMKNPDMKATYNIWPFASEHNMGYRLVDNAVPNVSSSRSWGGTYSWKFFKNNISNLHPDIMIASRKYTPEIAAQCRKWNRKYGIWSWYTSDQECTASLHVEAERLGREFAALDKDTKELEYFSIPSNCHSLNAAGIYIAAKLLWHSQRDPWNILKEFCSNVFGPKISRSVYAGYSAIAKIRNHDVDGDSAFGADYIGAGTDDPDKDAKVAGLALKQLKVAEVDEKWVSKIPLAYDRKELLDDLKEHLNMIYQYSLFRSAYVKLSAKEKIRPRDIQKLPKIEKFKKSGGMLEWRKVQILLKTLHSPEDNKKKRI